MSQLLVFILNDVDQLSQIINDGSLSSRIEMVAAGVVTVAVVVPAAAAVVVVFVMTGMAVVAVVVVLVASIYFSSISASSFNLCKIISNDGPILPYGSSGIMMKSSHQENPTTRSRMISSQTLEKMRKKNKYEKINLFLF